MNSLRIIDACTEEHFAAMSRIHARGLAKQEAERREAGEAAHV